MTDARIRRLQSEVGALRRKVSRVSTADLRSGLTTVQSELTALESEVEALQDHSIFGDNLIPNAGFEADTIHPNIVFDDGGGQADWTISATGARTGDQCLQVDTTGVATSASTRFMLRGTENVFALHVPCRTGDRFWFHFWAAAATSPNRVRTRSEFWNSSGHQGGAGTSAFTAPGTSYEKIGHRTSAAPSGVEWIVFDIEVIQDDAAGQVIRFDDVYVTPNS